MKKICLIIHSLQPGGMERVMAQLATWFSTRSELDVHLVLYGIKRELFYPVPINVTVHKPAFAFSNSRRVLDTIKTLCFLRSVVKSICPDSVLSFGEIWNNLVLLALMGLSFPVYISDRSQPGKNLGILHNMLKSWLYPKASGFIAQTEKARDLAMLRGLNKNIQVIGNPIRDVLPGRNDEHENIILTVGRLIKSKNLDQLIRIFVELDMPEWKLVIVGGDAQRQDNMQMLRQLIGELAVEDRVVLAGNRTDVDSFYRKASIFAFTSSSEGFPNVVGEAMSAGLPVVAYDCEAGPSEMINDYKNGFLVPVFDFYTFAWRLKLLMQHTELRDRLGKNARESIQRFSLEKIGMKFYCFIKGDELTL